MYSKQALRQLSIDGPMLTDAQKTCLDQDGFFIVEGVLTVAEAKAMGEEFDRLSLAEGAQGGSEVHIEPGAPRVSNIFNKTSAYDCCLECVPLLGASSRLLGEFKVHGANLREPAKGAGHQELHADVPKNFPDDWWVSNGLFLFDDMTAENGPTRVIPGSHYWPSLNVSLVNQGGWDKPQLSEAELALIPDDLEAPHQKEIIVEAPAGSVVIINSALWHSGTLNRTGARRRVLHLTYTRRDLHQQLYQRDHMTPQLYDRMSPAQRFLLDIEPLPRGFDEDSLRPKRGNKKGWRN